MKGESYVIIICTVVFQKVIVGFCILYEEFSRGDREREGVGAQHQPMEMGSEEKNKKGKLYLNNG